MKRQHSYQFRVPNNDEGRLFLTLARRFNAAGHLRCRGRAKNRRLVGRNYCQDVPVANAEWLAVYHEPTAENEAKRREQWQRNYARYNYDRETMRQLQELLNNRNNQRPLV